MGKPYAPKTKRWMAGETTPPRLPPTLSARDAPYPMNTPASVPRARTRGSGMAALAAPVAAAAAHRSAPTTASATGRGAVGRASASVAGAGSADWGEKG